MVDQVFKEAGDWALASDGVQWILQRRYAISWRNVSFVRSSKDILARCMRENGVESLTAINLLSGLLSSFDEWKGPQNAHSAPMAAKNLKP